jgi:hypothetical protein
MKQLTIFFFIAGIASILSCNNDNIIKGVIVDVGVNIFLKDEQGENLLNTSNYNSDNFKIFHEIDGQKIEVYNPLMDSPKGFSIINENNLKYINLSMNMDENVAIPITYIQWNDTDTDTLKTTYSRKENSVIWNKLWLNNKVVWDSGTPNGPTGMRDITIIK